MSYFRNSEEWQWLFKNAFDWEGVLPVYYPSYPTPEGWNNLLEVQAFFKEMLEQICKWCEEKVAPRAALLDQQGP